MLPLDALSTATAVLQFIDFTCKFISTTNQIRKDGSSVTVQFVRDSTSNLTAWNAGLRHRRRLIAKDNATILQLEKEIDEVLAGCTNIANELIALIAKLSSSKDGFLESIRTTFLTLLNKEKLEQMHAKLQTFRDDLIGYTIALCDEKLERHSEDVSERLDCLEHNQKDLNRGQDKILEILTFSRDIRMTPSPEMSDSVAASELAVLRSQLSSQETEEKTVVQQQVKDERAISAILLISNEKGGLYQRFLSAPTPNTSVAKPADTIERATLFERTTRGVRSNQSPSEPFLPIVRSVLGALTFQTIRLREESIAPAHKRTFEWVFEEKESTDHSGRGKRPYKSGFCEWLETSNGIYWINGKPGSGKSTFMKFINNDKRTMDSLGVWAGNKRLLVATHFFSSRGTELQKSFAGMLRSLLKDCLSKDQTLIPVAFPEACRQVYQGFPIDSFMVSDLHDALKRILSADPMRRKICLLIDGADEMLGPEEEVENLGALLSEIAKLTNVKIVVSSRPQVYFTRLFDNWPTFRLQDLTRSDIRIYVDDNLRNDRDMAQLLDNDRSLGNKLGDEITEKAAGVFLWVRLVVRSLCRGLMNGDSARDLHRRLEEMPAGLEEFYAAIFDKMSQEYRRDAARLCCILAHAIDMRAIPMSVLQMSFAMDDTLETAIKKPKKLMLAEERTHRCKLMVMRLAARTWGLIEPVRQAIDHFAGSSVLDLNLHFLHKTVLDYLALPNIREKQAGYLVSFDANLALLASCLCEIKVLPSENAIIASSDRAMIIALYLRSGCVLYVANKTLASTVTVDVRTALLGEMIHLVFGSFLVEGVAVAVHENAWRFNLTTAIRHLLDQGADPNAVIQTASDPTEGIAYVNPSSRGSSSDVFRRGKFTIWEVCLLRILTRCNEGENSSSDTPELYTPESAIELFQLCTMFLSKKAHLSVLTTPREGYARTTLLNAFKIDQLPLSVGTVLERLRTASLESKNRVFVNAVKEGDIQRVEAAYREAKRAYQRRKLGGRILLELESIWSWIEQLLRASAFQFLLTFVAGGLVVLMMSRWMA